MPTIAYFYGIAICMYYDDHNPPHFHAFYGEHEAKIAIDSGEVIEGKLPRRAMRLGSWKGFRVSMLTKVTKLERLGGFRLGVHFNDGSHGVHDFAALVSRGGEMRYPQRDPDYFQRVFLEFGAPTWPNGYDMAPEWLRREMEQAGELTRVAAE